MIKNGDKITRANKNQIVLNSKFICSRNGILSEAHAEKDDDEDIIIFSENRYFGWLNGYKNGKKIYGWYPDGTHIFIRYIKHFNASQLQ